MPDFVTPRAKKIGGSEGSFFAGRRNTSESKPHVIRSHTRRVGKRLFTPFFSVLRRYFLSEVTPLLLSINGRVHVDAERLEAMELEIASLNSQMKRNAVELDEIIRLLKSSHQDSNGE